ncbi:transcription-repair coupling factor [Fusobacterium gastrosuis]|uniref:transcription-repair coupling factor n=1 Tax=Fusobacterium gastrosuis TaxID=1755100 RepID=UPI0029769502|nr:transcription-repair coupling factor [Fusobacteriaceae bacterium]MDY5712535.1 transcription-repair coupling factor [Fusobacterium gastrosuis]
MEKKFRGEIPFWLKEKENNIVYVCSSNRNIDDYFYVLRDFYDRKILKIKIENEIGEIRKYNYDLLELLKSKEKFIILISMELFLNKYFYETDILKVSINKNINLKELILKLEKAGFEKVYMIENRKQYSLRGDILDIFNENDENPLRIELFGEEVDRISYFDINSQVSIEKKNNIEMYIDSNKNEKNFLEIIEFYKSKVEYFYENKEMLNYKLEKNIFDNIHNDINKEEELRNFVQEFYHKATEIEIQKFSEKELKEFEIIENIKNMSMNKNIKIYSEEEARYREIFKNYSIKFEKYPLFEGYKKGKNIILTDREIKGIRVKREKKEKISFKYQSVDQIRENEYIIHENYGVGIYLGLENIEGKDYLKIKYADEDKLFVPIEGINKIEKYISMDEKIPSIYNLGTRGFKRKKEKLKEDMMIFAKEIIEIQAKRAAGNGFFYSADTVWQEEFEEAFPYVETPSQLKAIEDVKKDMESGKIMDRLICGDVGYGKTEVAIRAAFKAIMDQKQVVLLVPTTVLAEQHYERFKERFLNYPITIEILSRVQTKIEQDKSLENIKKGVADLIIGTHRLLSDDIVFYDLGLLIIDEEQKFGVKAKEKLKKIKGNINILTLTATPIPRTLNLSLLGIRDLSLINTPPEGRLKIKTEYIENDKNIIKEVIMKELSREGQVFYIYNRVKRIEEKKNEIKEILPNYVNVEYIHGKMLPKDIKRTLLNFENGNIDILISTIIIENGIDIENANTMIIDGVEKLGLAQVYQLRGRIGRSNKQSYCYMLMNDNKSKKAEKREESIKNFDNSSGLELSMEDIKIRGVGEILGEKQHGAVETFGYNLYMKMLNEEINKIKGIQEEKIEIEDINIKLNFEKYIPDFYIDKDEKIRIYKRALSINNKKDLENLAYEIIDRFGKMPEEAKGFFKFLEIKLKCKELGIIEVIEKDKKLYLTFLEERVNIEKIISLIKKSIVTYLKIEKKIVYAGDIFDFFSLYEENKYSNINL